MMKIIRFFFVAMTFTGLLCLLTACGPTVNQIKPVETVTINPSFQAQTSPVPTVPPYRCGSWASNNAPGTYSTISIYAKLVGKDAQGVAGATAQAVAHFQNSDLTLDTQPKSDKGGFVVFTLSLQGRQPSRVPATVDVSFTVNKTKVTCSSAFFTPQ
ncbi:hypothetical protein [Reticulibacter mediterranei]|nr:hypothetical protein [Reticulibacter mediterranei]